MRASVLVMLLPVGGLRWGFEARGREEQMGGTAGMKIRALQLQSDGNTMSRGCEAECNKNRQERPVCGQRIEKGSRS